MAETNKHATMQSQVALTEFVQPGIIRNEQKAPGSVVGSNFSPAFSNAAEAPSHVIVTISSDAGHNTTADNAVSQESADQEPDNTKNIEDTKTKLLERGVTTIASATAAILSHFLRVLNHHQEGYYIILVVFLLMGLAQVSTATWTSRTRLAQVVVLLALVPQILVTGVITSTFTN